MNAMVKCGNCGHTGYDIKNQMMHGDTMSITFDCVKCNARMKNTYRLERVDADILEQGGENQ